MKLKRNPYSWNSKANVIFLDQPVGTGMSYSSGSSVDRTTQAAEDVYSFLTQFFERFPQYSSHKFHIAGESYAGHYIPVFSQYILSQKNKNFNLTSVMIGNGLTDPLTQYSYYQPMACGQGGAPAVVSQNVCQNMQRNLPACLNLIQTCYNNPNSESCFIGTLTCEQSQLGPYQQTGKNVYDVRKTCDPNSNGLCYEALNYVNQYLNQANVKQALGVQNSITFQDCNNQINSNFINSGDWLQPTQRRVANVLDAGVPVLIYAGDKDYICNWLGNRAWTQNLQWSGQTEFKQTKTRKWLTKDKKTYAGDVTNARHFTFVRLFNAGHLVPHDQPENSLDMVNRWISGDYSLQGQNGLPSAHQAFKETS
ncbi:carboxypeptidase C PRC1 [Sugiyamaella lignohabitans]|uniref:Carboxypeptidase n=1 Tax=Sugiyamaella lignohabitans TaxID=796027 RepID=A0A167EMP9_9ASCO|nr:carboxypeptidase C PRC1 [Sugiyamaella lignohabitans]ANB14263.1 carboxypeptidase C PRC1 [Sugiyamaella lignohabitans]